MSENRVLRDRGEETENESYVCGASELLLFTFCATLKDDRVKGY